MPMGATYQVKPFRLSGLNGISNKTLEMHLKLYEGSVKQTNLLTEEIAEFGNDGHIDQEEMPAAGMTKPGGDDKRRIRQCYRL